ncbi:hypothetical protein [Chlorogloeopsis sp. ULAP02]|uniref:hypothetical protein n=1 Tax=Chlorogloeopsis sp. ULAP02 TaxID=3107926 RepID=UPI003137636F
MKQVSPPGMKMGHWAWGIGIKNFSPTTPHALCRETLPRALAHHAVAPPHPYTLTPSFKSGGRRKDISIKGGICRHWAASKWKKENK